MSFSLTIDQGNSAAKVIAWDGDVLIDHWTFDDFSLAKLIPIIDRYAPDSAIYSSVTEKGSEVTNSLKTAGLRVIELTHETPLPIKIGYKTPATLGCDRIAAAAGAWNMYPNKDLLIVDLGTAITYDRITANGLYIGGNIAPGLRMRLEALNSYTARLPLVEAAGEVKLWGDSTSSALRAGAVNGVIGEISYYRNRLGADAVTIVTGGDAQLIASRLDFEVEMRPHLVGEGLKSILRYNENI